MLLGEVTAIQTTPKSVSVKVNGHQQDEAYDYLIVAAGSSVSYFGNDAIREHAFEMRTLDDAVILRNHALKLFERAAWTDDPQEREALTTMVIVGGGPTGLETAGAIYELYNDVLNKEYPGLKTRVVLIEMQGHLLTPYPAKLRQAALKQLQSLGVEVILGTAVKDVGADQIVLSDERVIRTHMLVWSAGVKASPIATMLGVELVHGSRLHIEETTQVSGLDAVDAVGDIAYLEDLAGSPYPMMIPPAMQQGRLAAQEYSAPRQGCGTKAFPLCGSWADGDHRTAAGGSMVLYNRIPRAAISHRITWLIFHPVTLFGFRNRLNVLVNWLWNYLTYDRSVRIILEPWDRRNNR